MPMLSLPTVVPNTSSAAVTAFSEARWACALLMAATGKEAASSNASLNRRRSTEIPYVSPAHLYIGNRPETTPYGFIRQGDLSLQPLIAAAAHLVSLSAWQVLQALGIFIVSVSTGVMKWKLWVETK